MLTLHACTLVFRDLRRLHGNPCLAAARPVLHREADTALESLKEQLWHLPPDLRSPKANTLNSVLLDVSPHGTLRWPRG